MREILFRGKSMNDGEWVQGSLVITVIEPADDTPYKHYHIEDMTIGVFPNEFQSGLSETVAPETVGQFIGLTDKDGKKIFEGDIIQYSIEEEQAVFIGAVKFGEFNPSGGALLNTNVGFYVELVDLEGKRTYMRKDIGYWVKFRGIEVIGNIHDNPELLEV